MSMPKTKTRREKVEHREETIIEAAREIFNHRGYRKTTMAEIAKQSGVADGTVYLYFKNKEDLARAVITDFYRRLTDSAQQRVDQLSTTKERVTFLARHHLSNVMAEFKILEMLPAINVNMESYGGSALFDLNKNYVAIFDRIAKDGMQSGAIKSSLTPWVLRDIFYGSMEYGSRTMLLKSRPEDIDDFVDQLVGMVMSSPKSAKANLDATIADRLELAATRIEKATAKL
ncbi:MAG: TetR/AcrR family transcriptional regulator [Acidimicrobiales bacterium]|nr:TetR/AcrR family transcriptional regulator [Hyphomonadaceae bacterium]RZV39982.1 MAG: TetR/AcrR family transcriptional regulator [Acidimicrobiales bacterium]